MWTRCLSALIRRDSSSVSFSPAMHLRALMPCQQRASTAGLRPHLLHTEDNASVSPAKYIYIFFWSSDPRAHLRPHPASLCWEHRSTSQHSNGWSHPSPWCVATPWGLINTTHCASIWLRVIKQILGGGGLKGEGDRVGWGGSFPPCFLH